MTPLTKMPDFLPFVFLPLIDNKYSPETWVKLDIQTFSWSIPKNNLLLTKSVLFLVISRLWDYSLRHSSTGWTTVPELSQSHELERARATEAWHLNKGLRRCKAHLENLESTLSVKSTVKGGNVKR